MASSDLKLNPTAFAHAAVLIVILFDMVAYVWHGALQQPSLANAIYPGFWTNPVLLAAALISSLIGAYAFGYLFARTYNWHIRRFR